MKTLSIHRYDSRARSLLKSLSWRVLGSMFTAFGAFILTHSFSLSFYISVGEFIAKIVLYYCHERLWQNISLGTLVTSNQRK